MNQEAKDRLLGMFLAVLDGRSPRHHVIMLDGDDCIQGHKIIAECDELLRAQWKLMGSPDEDPLR